MRIKATILGGLSRQSTAISRPRAIELIHDRKHRRIVHHRSSSNVCPQRLDALTDMLRLTHEGAMRACHILVPILLFESLYGAFILNPGETVVVVLVAQDARAS